MAKFALTLLLLVCSLVNAQNNSLSDSVKRADFEKIHSLFCAESHVWANLLYVKPPEKLIQYNAKIKQCSSAIDSVWITYNIFNTGYNILTDTSLLCLNKKEQQEYVNLSNNLKYNKNATVPLLVLCYDETINITYSSSSNYFYPVVIDKPFMHAYFDGFYVPMVLRDIPLIYQGESPSLNSKIKDLPSGKGYIWKGSKQLNDTMNVVCEFYLGQLLETNKKYLMQRLLYSLKDKIIATDEKILIYK